MDRITYYEERDCMCNLCGGCIVKDCFEMMKGKGGGGDLKVVPPSKEKIYQVCRGCLDKRGMSNQEMEWMYLYSQIDTVVKQNNIYMTIGRLCEYMNGFEDTDTFLRYCKRYEQTNIIYRVYMAYLKGILITDNKYKVVEGYYHLKDEGDGKYSMEYILG